MRRRTRRAVLTLLAGLALPASLILLAGCGAQGDRPGVIILADMSESIPYDAYDRNPVTPLGQTLLLPPAGTVPLGAGIYPYGPGPEEALRAGRDLINPLTATADNMARAQREYFNKCQVCHGPGGDGDGPIIGRFPNPPSYHADHAKQLPDGQIFHIISHGQGIMPSHAAQVLPENRWRLVLHLRKLHGLLPEAAPEVPVAAASAAPLGGTGGQP